jgi:hypothetical protein
LASTDVFINCPFDAEYEPLFEALVFAVAAAGYKARCALEDNDAANIRFDKLRKLIQVCPRTIHDLSRTEVGKNALPRFNMPLELGLAMGLKYFGGRKVRGNSALIMVKERYALPVYLSDLAGADPQAHEGKPANVVGLVTRYLKITPEGKLLPGSQFSADLFENFKKRLPTMAQNVNRKPQEVAPFHDYLAFVTMVDEFLKNAVPKVV